MKKHLISFGIVCSVLVFGACGEKHEDDSKKAAEEFNESKFENTGLEDDMEFVIGAADGGMFEVQAGELAKVKGMSQEIKDLGQHMVDDHSKANEELKLLATKKNITLPVALGEEHQKHFNDLNEKSGTDFDKAYADMMVKDHKKDIKEFEDEADHGKDEEVKNWASGKLAVLKHHLEMAENTQKNLK
jgi:putative membrane protein